MSRVVILCSVSDFFSAVPYLFGAPANMPAWSCSFTCQRWTLGPVPHVRGGDGWHSRGRLLGYWWPSALRSGRGWMVAQHLCVWGELAWQQRWEIEFPAHLGGSCGPAFLARPAEPSRAGSGWALCPPPAFTLGTGFLAAFGKEHGECQCWWPRPRGPFASPLGRASGRLESCIVDTQILLLLWPS